MSPSPPRIGITAPRDHPVFGVVGDRLTADGYTVSFLNPAHPIPDQTIRRLTAFVPKRIRPATVKAVRRAEELGIPTWNSATGVTSCVSRFTQTCLLESAGFAVPEIYRDVPDGEYVAQDLYHWGGPPTPNGDGDLYEEYLETDGIDYKYYVVDTGAEYRSAVLRTTSKLGGDNRVLGTSDPIDSHVDRITALMTDLDLCGVGVDLVRVDDEWYAVDLNLGPSYAQTGLEEALVTSIESLSPLPS